MGKRFPSFIIFGRSILLRGDQMAGENRLLKLLKKGNGDALKESPPCLQAPVHLVERCVLPEERLAALREEMPATLQSRSPAVLKQPEHPRAGDGKRSVEETPVLAFPPPKVPSLQTPLQLYIEGKPATGEILTLCLVYMNVSKERWKSRVLRCQIPAGLSYLPHSTMYNGKIVQDSGESSLLFTPQGLPIEDPGSEEVSVRFKAQVDPSAQEGASFFCSATLEEVGGAVTRQVSGEIRILSSPAFTAASCRIEVDADKTVSPHQVVTCSIHLENSGNAPASGVALTSPPVPFTHYLPNSTTIGGVPALDLQGTSPLFTKGGCYLGAIPPKSSVQVTCKLQVDLPLDPGTEIPIKGEVYCDQTSLSLDPCLLKVISRADFSKKEKNFIHGEPAGEVEAGTILTYTVSFFNSGDANAHHPLVKVISPADATYIEGSTLCNGESVPDQQFQSPLLGRGLSLPEMKVGAGVEVTFQAKVNSLIENGSTLICQAELEYAKGEKISLPPATNTVRSFSDFSRSTLMVDPPGSIEPGNVLTYFLRLVNTGTALHARNVRLKISPPTSARYVPESTKLNGKPVGDIRHAGEGSQTSGSSAADSAPQKTRAEGTEALSPIFTESGLVIDRVEANRPYELSFQVRVHSPAENGITLTQEASIEWEEQSPRKGDPAVQALRPVTTLVSSTANFSTPRENFVEVHPAGEVAPGETVTYRIHLTNTGLVHAKEVRLKGEVPPFTSYLPNKTKVNGIPVADEKRSSPLFSHHGFSLGPIPVGQAKVVTFQVKVDSPLEKGKMITGTVNVVSEVSPPFSLPVPSLKVKSTPDFSDMTTNFLEVYPEGKVPPGQILTYVIQYNNTGNAEAKKVAIRATLPGETLYVPGSTRLNGLTVADRKEISPLFSREGLLLDNIPSQGVGNVSFQVRVKESCSNGAPVTCSAVTECPEAKEPVITNSAQNLVCTVVDFSDPQYNFLELFPTQTVFPGDILTYTVRFKNTGKIPAKGATLCCRISPFVTYLHNSTILNGSPVTDLEGVSPILREGLPLGDVRPEDGGAAAFRVVCSSPLDHGIEIPCHAEIACQNGETFFVGTARCTVSSAPSFQDPEWNCIEVVESDAPGEPRTFIVNFRNTGTANARDVRMKVSLPEGAVALAETIRINGLPAGEDGRLLFTEEGFPFGKVLVEEGGNVSCQVSSEEHVIPEVTLTGRNFSETGIVIVS